MTWPRLLRSRRACVLGLLVTACVVPVPPAIFARLDSVRTAPASLEAEQWAPQARAHALGLEERAHRALADGDSTSAELLAENALAAHERARVLTRRARAEQRRARAQLELEREKQTLAGLHAQHQRLSAEAAALELRARVLRDAMPLPEHDKPSPERRLARRRAAGALATQARLLCLSAGLLDAGAPSPETLAELSSLEEQLAAGSGRDVLEQATSLRSRCLATLSGIRRERDPGALPQEPSSGTAPSSPAQATAPAPDSLSRPPPADALLSVLSDSGVEPSRDDRGVSVVLRDEFAGDGRLSEAGVEKLERLARVAKAHPDFPVLLVGHAGAPRRSQSVDRRLATVEERLGDLGVARVASHNAGWSQPLLPRGARGSVKMNERVELVFVAPGL